ncbi:MAG TPA: glycosyltransferase family 4 protein [Candidatus Saccharimonadales bacterium]|jgi:glycosyltransferase involved in cell wall biosynthesis|nr:glycosyltransferase family 4 protein [Candidatus Saccharimonadales bacterium]
MISPRPCEAPASETLPADKPAVAPSASTPRARLRVAYLDLWCFIPYYMAAITTALADQNIQPQLLSSSYRLDPEYFRRRKIANNRGLLDLVSRRQVRIPWLRRWLKLTEYCFNLTLFTLKLLFAPPEIIHIQYLALLSRGLPVELWMLRIAKWRGIRLVCTVHNVLPHDTGDRYKAGFSRLYAMADLLICHNRAARARIEQEFGIPSKRIEVIPHGPLQQLPGSMTPQEAVEDLQLPKDRIIVLWQGVIAAYKGIEFLLEAWKHVSSKALLLIAGAGEGPLLAKIKAKVEEPESDLSNRVRLDFGFIPPEKLPAYYQAASVLVYPYSQITTSGALLTGLGYGKPIVATRLPAFEEMFHEGKAGNDGQSALLVEYGDARSLAAAINSLIESEPLRTRLGAASKRLAETAYSWEQIAIRTRQAYDALLND